MLSFIFTLLLSAQFSNFSNASTICQMLNFEIPHAENDGFIISDNGHTLNNTSQYGGSLILPIYQMDFVDGYWCAYFDFKTESDLASLDMAWTNKTSYSTFELS